MNFDPSLALPTIIIQIAAVVLFGWGIFSLQRQHRFLGAIWLTGGLLLTGAARFLPYLVVVGNHSRPAAVSSGIPSQQGKPNNRKADSRLAAARSKFTTVIKNEISAPQPGNVDKILAAPDHTAKRVTYPSGDLQLAAWISKDPGDGKRHPAVVFLHGGFALGKADWTDTQPFRDAGFIVMTPAVRAENGNPGNFELFYSEVDDAIAAGEYVANLPFVDPERVYVTGHSLGGQLTVLVAQMNSPYRAAVSFSASALDVNNWIQPLARSRSAAQKEQLVFDHLNAKEVELRNPMKFADDVQIPLVLLSEIRTTSEQRNFTNIARNADCPVIQQHIHGDHFTMLGPAIRETVPWFRLLNSTDDASLKSRRSLESLWKTKSAMRDPFEFARRNSRNANAPKFATTLNVSGYSNIQTGMTLEEVTKILGEPPGHHGELPRGKTLTSLVSRYGTQEKLEKTWSLGWVINAEFDGERRLITSSIRGGRNREIQKAVNSLKPGMSLEEVEEAFKQPLSTEASVYRQSRKTWASGDSTLTATFLNGESSGGYSCSGGDQTLNAACEQMRDKSQTQMEAQIDELLKDTQKEQRTFIKKTWQGPGRTATAEFDERNEMTSIRIFRSHPEIQKKIAHLTRGTPRQEVERVIRNIMKDAPESSEKTWTTPAGYIAVKLNADKFESCKISGDDPKLHQLAKTLSTGMRESKVDKVFEGMSKGSRTHNWRTWSTPTVSISVEFDDGIKKSTSMNGTSPSAKRLYEFVNTLKTEEEVDAALFELRHGGAPRNRNFSSHRMPTARKSDPTPHRVNFRWQTWTSDTQFIAIRFEEDRVAQKTSQPRLGR